MPENYFANYPDDASLWIYSADRQLSADEQSTLLKNLSPFLADWSSHGRAVCGEAHVVANQFIFIAGTIPGGDISGCGIDSSVHALENARSSLEFNWLPQLQILFRDDQGNICHVDRASFRQLIRDGYITLDTIVFDTSIHTVGAFRRREFECDARTTWHSSFFSVAAI